MITVVINDRRLLAGVQAAWLAGRPQDEESQLYYPRSPQEWLQQVVEAACRSYRDQYGPDKINVADFIIRAPDVFSRVAQDSSNDPVLTALLARLRSEAYVWLESDEVRQGVQYLVQRGYITPEQAQNLLAY